MSATQITTAPSIGAVLQEAAALAREFEDSPLWARENVREGAITIQQQAQRYADAQDDETRADAATWAREGFQILSSGLPDSHEGNAPNERLTGWATAADIGKLFGAEFTWLARVRLAFSGPLPDASKHNPAPDYLRALLLISGHTQRAAAERIGIGERLMRYYLTPAGGNAESRVAPYPVQFALERLAVGG